MINGQLDNYTISVYTLIENNFDFGLNDYPIFDETYRDTLNNAILNFYMFHEIGWINPSVFKHFLKTRMDLIMRNKYNKLYEQKLIEFNPLYNVDSTETFTRNSTNSNNSENTSLNTINSTNNTTNDGTDTTTSTSDTTSDNTADALMLHSNYPSEDMANGGIEDNVYIDSGQKQTNTTNNTENTSDESTTESHSTSENVNSTTNNGSVTVENNGEQNENYTRTLKGSSPFNLPSKALQDYKKYIESYNLDAQVIAELSDLFINIY